MLLLPGAVAKQACSVLGSLRSSVIINLQGSSILLSSLQSSSEADSLITYFVPLFRPFQIGEIIYT